MEENSRNHWLKIALITFATSFLAFYLVMEIMIHRITNPIFDMQRIERSVQKDFKRMENYENKLMENPFEPKMRPMLVNLVKEGGEYRVIVDLKPFDGDEKGINVNVEDKVLMVSGELDKKFHGNEKIIRFNQAYYLDDKMELDKISKEKKGDKYIITIPFED
jgi:HSP20 family molecular chaperone IbpA